METPFLLELDSSQIPTHVAIILDGNGRWAQHRGMERVEGHRVGAERVRDIVRAAGKAGIKFLTLYALSIDNRKRPLYEVQSLYALLEHFAVTEQPELIDQDVKVEVVGDVPSLPDSCQAAISELCKATAHGTTMVLRLAVAYGAREDLIQATKKLAERVARGELKSADIDEPMLREEMWTAGAPSPDLIIRTGGEHRLSDFLLLEAAYAELYFVDLPWPDFTPDRLHEALTVFAQRDRRFGLVKTGSDLPGTLPAATSS
jgi:undecaprenyl diphosphate synthase